MPNSTHNKNTVVPSIFKKGTRTSKAVFGIIGSERRQECLYLGGGWFATCYLPAGHQTEILFEGLYYEFSVYIPVYKNTKASVTLIRVDALDAVKSTVRIPKFMPKTVEICDRGDKMLLKQTYLNDNATCRPEMKLDNHWLRQYGVLKYSLPGDKPIRFHTHLTQVTRLKGHYYGVIAYHVAHKPMGRNAYGGLRIFTQKTFEQEFQLYR